jgi:hypothetical protein
MKISVRFESETELNLNRFIMFSGRVVGLCAIFEVALFNQSQIVPIIKTGFFSVFIHYFVFKNIIVDIFCVVTSMKLARRSFNFIDPWFQITLTLFS